MIGSPMPEYRCKSNDDWITDARVMMIGLPRRVMIGLPMQDLVPKPNGSEVKGIGPFFRERSHLSGMN